MKSRHTLQRASAAFVRLLIGCLLLSPLAAKEFKVISWNVLYGFNRGKKIEAGSEWIRKQQPDVVALQELNGFTEKSLAKAAASWGHPHSAILKKDGFPVGITSKTPIEVVAKLRKGLWHGCLHARTADTDFMVIHLCPGVRETREKEMKLLAPRVSKLLGEKRRLFLLGDFNDKSPADIAFTNSNKAIVERAKPGNLLDGKFDAGVVGGFLDAGLVDSAKPLPSNFSTPTRMKPFADDPSEQYRYLQRIDLVLTDAVTAAEVRTVHTSQDAVLDTVSDHYPVIHSSERK
ncbi:endonuclease/exonuclease/phosphatase family protein [Luteolibacter flavescens]|uniref:Endonuclease/exonuclease/phosphatase family protein n=1 Tax=Luteolibacter flavescens TaxID=1859460 RepID=A0ABT3FKK6_9BACT|nr:endonuclease/exonuclease/phosphatase family protein [Luteolibacter flavescens]MCW1883874.1 endonuclease/exonuclease/phosphatase family protein [Luteolibacter flavescens]